MTRNIKKGSDFYGTADAHAVIDVMRSKGSTVTEPSAEVPSEPPPDVIAYINHGRWVGDCKLWDASRNRTCLNAQYVDEADPRFYCVICFNAACDNAWRDVIFPEDTAAVEEPLEPLTESEQNWEPEV